MQYATVPVREVLTSEADEADMLLATCSAGATASTTPRTSAIARLIAVTSILETSPP
jgi:hypothetical protein